MIELAKKSKYSAKCGNKVVRFRLKRSKNKFLQQKKRAQTAGRLSAFCRRF